jgi:hypothetical protein
VWSLMKENAALAEMIEAPYGSSSGVFIARIS